MDVPLSAHIERVALLSEALETELSCCWELWEGARLLDRDAVVPTVVIQDGTMRVSSCLVEETGKHCLFRCMAITGLN